MTPWVYVLMIPVSCEHETGIVVRYFPFRGEVIRVSFDFIISNALNLRKMK